MRATLSIGSTVVQGVVLLLGAFLILSYVVSPLRQSFQHRNAPEERGLHANWSTQLFFNLGLLGLYGLFAYFWVVEEMTDTGFRALARMLDGGI